MCEVLNDGDVLIPSHTHDLTTSTVRLAGCGKARDKRIEYLVISWICGIGPVCEQEALKSHVVSIPHSCMHAHISRDPSELRHDT